MLNPLDRKYFRPPQISPRFIPIWRRNFLVWEKLAIPSILGNLADPLLYMLGLGYGLGVLLPQINGMSYITFLAAGTLCYSTMNTASFEALYSAFARMHVQKTWDAILHAPLTLDDVLFAELVWASSKSFLSGLSILLIIWVLGLSHSWMLLLLIPLIVLIGLSFAGFGLIMTSICPSYEFFLYYFTLFITPMVLLCGVFFPVSQLPPFLQDISSYLPLTHAIELARPLVSGRVPERAFMHILVLAGYGFVGFYMALVLTRRRLQN